MARRWISLGSCVMTLACGAKDPAPVVGDGDAAKRAESKPEADARPDAKAEADAKAEPDAKTEADAKPEPETKPEARPHPRLRVAPTPDLAVVVTDVGVVALDAEGESVGTLLPNGGGWCRVDPRSEVLWAIGEQGLVMVDLRSDAEPVVVLAEPPETIVIAYPDEELGRPAGHEFQQGVAVHMADPPRLEAILGCDGDMVWYCFEGEVDDFEVALTELQQANAAELAKVPVPTAALAPIVARSKGRRAQLPDPGRAPEPKTVPIPSDGCEEEPEDCGTASVLSGTRYWQVVVGNSRGDFYHEDLQLFDPKSGEFFDPSRPGVRSKTPLADEDGFEPRWVSPSGALALGYDSVVSFVDGVVAKDLDGVCGFWGGGFEP